MTVRRENNEVFGKSPELVRQVLGNILAKNRGQYRYHDTTMSANGATFKTTIRPRLWPLVLQTHVSVQLVPLPDGGSTKVVVETKSQSFIFGDVFQLYNGYVQDVLRDLRDELSTVA